MRRCLSLSNPIYLLTILTFRPLSVLEFESNWNMRGIKEAMHIRSHPNTMNRVQGERHLLPGVWTPSSPNIDEARDPPRDWGAGPPWDLAVTHTTSHTADQPGGADEGAGGAGFSSTWPPTAVPSAVDLKMSADSGRNVKIVSKNIGLDRLKHLLLNQIKVIFK